MAPRRPAAIGTLARRAAPILAAALACLAAGASAEEPVAVLQGLDKVTARVSTIEAPIGRTVTFGSLQISARACTKRPPEEPPETAAFLEIDEVKAAEGRRRLFSGWMFASSPALSSLEHPVYDIWVVDCKNAESSSAGNSG